jgi:phenylpyruvate tautomerase PptA (4-oxalocrotonate tautomerase family)
MRRADPESILVPGSEGVAPQGVELRHLRYFVAVAARLTDVMVAFEGSEAFREVVWVLIEEVQSDGCATWCWPGSRWAPARSPAAWAATGPPGRQGGPDGGHPAVPAQDTGQPRWGGRVGVRRDQGRRGRHRPAYFNDFLDNFYSVDVLRSARISDQAWQNSFIVAVAASAHAAYACVDTWLTDLRADLPKIDVPTLLVHCDADRILPNAATAARLPGPPYGNCTHWSPAQPAIRSRGPGVIRNARCTDASLDADQWFPVSAEAGKARHEAAAAIAICSTCLVRARCLALSLRHWDIGQHGVWGGLVAAERAALRRGI